MKENIFLFINKMANLYNKFMPRINGLNLVYSRFYNLFNPNSVLLIEVQGSKMYVNSKETGIVNSLIINGVYEEYETELFKKLVNENTTLIDIGANIGYFTLLGSNIIKNGSIYSFEPEPGNYELLSKNLRINNLENAIAIQKAVSDKVSKVKIYLDEFNLGNHSLAENNVPNKIDYVEVATTTLDLFFEDKFDEFEDIFIKIDTQGAEGLIIGGADSLLKKESIKLMIEFWPTGLKNMGTEPDQLLKKLRGYGFKISLINSQKNCLDYLNNEEIIKKCNVSDGDQVNLLLEK